MNERFKMKNLSGGGSYFGSKYGAARVATVMRKGFVSESRSAALLFNHRRFTVTALNHFMSEEMEGNTNRRRVMGRRMPDNPDIVRQWIER